MNLLLITFELHPQWVSFSRSYCCTFDEWEWNHYIHLIIKLPEFCKTFHPLSNHCNIASQGSSPIACILSFWIISPFCLRVLYCHYNCSTCPFVYIYQFLFRVLLSSFPFWLLRPLSVFLLPVLDYRGSSSTINHHLALGSLTRSQQQLQPLYMNTNSLRRQKGRQRGIIIILIIMGLLPLSVVYQHAAYTQTNTNSLITL